MSRCIAVVVLLMSAVACAAPATDSKRVVAYENGLWYDGESFVAGTRYVMGERFVSRKPSTVYATVDLGGKHVVPPFGEAHTHFLEADAIEAYVQHYLERGVFYARDMSGVPHLRRQFAARLNRPDSIDYISANQGFTGPGGHPLQIVALGQQLGWLPAEWTMEDIDGEAVMVLESEADLDTRWPRFLEDRPDFVKVFLHYSDAHAARKADPTYEYRRGLDPALVAPIVRRAHAAELVVFAHAFTAEDVRAALDAGVDHLTHFPGLGYDEELGEDRFRLSDDDIDRIAAARMTITSTLADMFGSDGSRDEELRGYFERVIRPNYDRLRAAGVPILIGTDKPRETSDVEVATLMRLGLLDARQALHEWSVTTPQHIFPDRRIGRLAAGYEASFLVLAGNPLEDFENTRRIELLVKQGQPITLEPVDFPPFPSGR